MAILAESFNPPTLAHLALAEAALTRADQVLFVLPKVFPHKDYEGATMGERVAMLRAAVEGNERWPVGVADRGLFIEIASEAKEHYPDSDLWFVCGRDAAERIVAWDYGDPAAFADMLASFGLLASYATRTNGNDTAISFAFNASRNRMKKTAHFPDVM